MGCISLILGTWYLCLDGQHLPIRLVSLDTPCFLGVFVHLKWHPGQFGSPVTNKQPNKTARQKQKRCGRKKKLKLYSAFAEHSLATHRILQGVRQMIWLLRWGLSFSIRTCAVHPGGFHGGCNQLLNLMQHHEMMQCLCRSCECRNFTHVQVGF